MKLRTKIKALVLLCVLFCATPQLQAQGYTRGYISAGWQYNVPFSTGFTDKASGYGLYFDGGYYLTPFFSLGVFINHQQNYEYVPRQTHSISSTAEVNTDQQHRIKQLPFGISARYRFYTEKWQPYVSLKAGTSYISTYSDFHTLSVYDQTWGFHLSPEIGVALFPFQHSRLGFNLAAYYSYSSNHNEMILYDMKGVNNAGLRLGLIF